jgi:Family of unknown function (DUF5681)
MDASDRAEKTARIQRGRPFEPGKSGNPSGRPKGARNVATTLAEALLDGEASAITRKVIEKALEGDSAALRLCLERLLPPRRARPVSFELSEIRAADDAAKASSSVLAACAAGTLSLGEAAEFMGLIASHVEILETAELEARITALERAQRK